MKRNIIRSNVYVASNSMNGVYEVTDNPDKMRVNLRQEETWYEKSDKLCTLIKEVPYDTELAIHKRGHIMPGNIKVGYMKSPIIEDDPGAYQLYEEGGTPATDKDGNCIWSITYYDPMSPHCPTGELPDEERLDDIMGAYPVEHEDESGDDV